jgi:Zn-dependent peptidase ImmA (M78 family)
MTAEIGQRVARMLPEGRTQREIASEVGMAPDAFSRALRGERGFSAVELAKLADVLKADVYFLITGEPDPNTVRVSARHSYDTATGRHHIPGAGADTPLLEDIVLAYEQVQGDLPESDLPASIDKARAGLRHDFVPDFADRLAAFNIDVVRLTELTTSYSFFIGGRAVIALQGTPNWFRENFALAHELEHLLYQGKLMRSGMDATHTSSEPDANGFAAELLMPEAWMRTVDWESIPESDLAGIIWRLGVSTEALTKRINSLQLPIGHHVLACGSASTQRLLRRHMRASLFSDPITDRMNAAAMRRFPIPLMEAHLARIASGSLRKDTLAWMLAVRPEDLEVDEPADSATLSTDELADVLGL